MASELESKIIRQIEYYFGDINLLRDKFMQEKLQEDDGWFSLDVLLTFKRLATLSQNPEVIVAAIDKAENGLVQVSADRKKVRRNPNLPLPELNAAYKEELMERTAFANGFSYEEPLDDIISFLSQFGRIVSVIRRKTKTHEFKGSCFIIFADKNTCKNFIELENPKYKGIELVRKWQRDYFADEKKEREERVKARESKKQAKLEEKCKQRKYPRGTVIHFTGIPEGKSLNREAIEAKVVKVDKTVTISLIEFNRGDVEGYLTFKTENTAVEFIKKITDGEMEVGDVKLKLRVLEGAEEAEYLKKTSGMKKSRKRNRRSKNKGTKSKNANQKLAL